MKAINLFSYTRVGGDEAEKFENILSQSATYKSVKEHEYQTLVTLVEQLLKKNVEIALLDGFFNSFMIEQIGKEFDLLKVDRGNFVLNIELKSKMIDKKKIQSQLEQNEYYLKHLSDSVELFTFVGETKELFQYRAGSLKKVSMTRLVEALERFENYITEDLNRLFEAKEFLISPLNTPDKFLDGEYFLTRCQEEIKDNISKIFGRKSTGYSIVGITGKAGTGKTLLLYDLVKFFVNKGKRCCVIHSGITCEGHSYLNQNWSNAKIYAAKELNDKDKEVLVRQYDYIFVDEAQRIYKSTAEKLIEAVIKEGGKIILSYDYGQTLSISEENNNIPEYLNSLEGFEEFQLSEKIRTSKEIASFYKNLLDLNDIAQGYMNYENIEVLYAQDCIEALRLIGLYEEKYGYVFISYTQSSYKHSTIDIYPDEHNTHHVIGLEYDKVMIVIDEHFRYDNNGRIQGKTHPNPNYQFWKLLYQGVSRARERLCILVVDNYDMFKQIMEIKYKMLEKYQYKKHKIGNGISMKKLNKCIERIRKEISGLDEKNRETIYDAVCLIRDQIVANDSNKRAIKLGIAVLNQFIEDERKKVSEDIKNNLKDFIDYVVSYICL